MIARPAGMSVVSHRIDGELGAWTHTEWRPHADHPLARVVERIWDFDGWLADRRERVLPNGAVELIVQLDDRYHDVKGSHRPLTPATCVTGLQTGPMVIEAPSTSIRVLGVRLHPSGAWVVLDHPLSALTGLTADLDDVLGPAARELATRCYDADAAGERIAGAVAWLLERVKTSRAGRRTDPAVRWIASRLAASPEPATISALRGSAGLSAARLAAVFREQVGVTPKRYARIHRFRRTVELLQRRPCSLSDVALRAGYYDHPHLDADFREFAGVTPREFLNGRRYPSSASLAEG